MADRTVSIALEARVSSFVAGMKAAQRTVVGFAADLEKTAAKRAALKDLGNIAGGVGLVAAAGLGLAIKAAADFDQEMSNVQAATHENARNMDLLRKAALEWGQKTKFSNVEAAQGIEELGKAGVKTKDILQGGLKGALTLAAAGNIEVGTAAEDTASALNQFQLKGSQASHVADLLAASATKAQGEVGDMATALTYAGVPAHQLGISIEETVGVLGELAHAGIVGSMAGTSLRSMLQSLTSPSAEARKTMEDLNIQLFDGKGNFIGLAGTAEQLKKHLGDLTQEQRANALGQIFGNRSLQAAQILYRGGAKDVEEWTNKVNVQGFAAQTAAIKMDNLRGDLEKLGGAFSTALASTGEGAQGPFRSITQGLTSVVNAYNKLPSGVQGGVAAALGLTALGGLSFYAFSRTVQGINNTRNALVELGVTGAQARTAIAGIGPAATLMAAGFAVSKIQEWGDSLTHARLQVDDLNRSLQSLAKGRVDTTLFDTYGKDLHGLTDDFTTMQSKLAHVDNFFSGIVGAILPFAGNDSELSQAQDNFKALDEQLASMAEGGHGRIAAQAFGPISARAKAAGLSTKELAAIFPQYTAAVKNAGDSSRSAGGDVRGLGSAMGSAAAQTLTFKGALQQLTGILDKRDALRSYQAAIDEFRKGFKHIQGPDFNINKEAGRQNQALLDAIASSAENVAQKLHGVARVEFVQNAIGQLRAMANQMNLPKRQVDVLIAALVKLAHTSANPHVGVTFGNSFQQIRTLTSELHAIDNYNPTSTVTIETRRIGGPAPVTGATGGYIRGPGTATSDSIPALVSDREYVVRAAAVAKYGVNMMHAINAGRYATGGFVTRGQRHGSGSGGGGSAVQIVSPTFRLYDMDGQFVGSMRGEITDDHDMTATLRRQGVG